MEISATKLLQVLLSFETRKKKTIFPPQAKCLERVKIDDRRVEWESAHHIETSYAMLRY